MKSRNIVAVALAIFTTTPALAAPEADAALDRLADRLVALEIAYDSTAAYQLGVPAPDHRRWPDRSQAAIAAFDAAHDAVLNDLRGIDATALSPRQRFIHAGMIERL